MKLYRHQEAFKKSNPDKALLVWEGGTGKTVGACEWLKQGRDQDALVVCPKRICSKWEAELEKWGAEATVMSKEQFKKLPQREWSAKVIDEADEFASPLFTKGRSQLATALYNQTKAYPDTPTLLLTATPIRSNPYNLHTLLCYMGKYIDWRSWRDHYFNLEQRPYLPHPTWLPKKGWQKGIRQDLEMYGEIVLLKDCIDDLPASTEEVIKIKPTGKFKKDVEWIEPMKIFVEKHKWEHQNAYKKILEIGKEYRKILVVAHYTDDVELLKEKLSKDRTTFAVDGRLKGTDQEKILLEANSEDCEECFLIVQASLGAGFDADTFSCVVFSTMSFKARDHVQMKYRVRRIHNLHPVKYIYLIGGKSSQSVYDTIMKGKDFIPSEYGYATGTTTKKE